MKRKTSLEEDLQEANYFIDYYTERLHNCFKEQKEIIKKAREILKNQEKPSKDFIKKIKKNQKNIQNYRETLRYLNNIQNLLEDQIELSKLF